MDQEEREMRSRTLPLDWWERWEIKGFCLCFQREFREREREREIICQKKCSKNIQIIIILYIFLKSRGFGGIYSWFVTFQLLATLESASRLVANVSNLVLSQFWFQLLTGRLSQNLIEIILVSMEMYECIVSRTLDNLEIQRSDQKLWPQEWANAPNIVCKPSQLF